MRRLALFALPLAALLIAPDRAAQADDGSQVVATVGDGKLTVDEVERRLRGVPVWQLPTLGKTPAEIRRNFLEKVLIPELLFEQEARRQKVDADPAAHERLRAILRQAMENRLRETVASDKSVTAEELKAYYDQNLHRFHTPRRIKLWRILVADEARAKKIIADMKQGGEKAAKAWTDAAREHSLDKATHLRDGNLGFVHPDGQTEAPRVRVDPALFAAADKVGDGQIVQEPVKEGDKWAVIWRRGSMEEVHRTLAQEESAIRQVLQRKKLEEAMSKLLDKLQNEQLKGRNDALLEYVSVDPYGDIGARRKPGVVPRSSAPGSPTPRSGERGRR
jgi:peptidyl-prolyl cis-trans isomerase C